MKNVAAFEGQVHKDVPTVKDALYTELDPLEECDPEYAQKFADSQGISDEKVETFLRDCPLYNGDEWPRLSTCKTEGPEQYAAAVDILNAIIDQFVDKPKTRRAVRTYRTQLKHACDVRYIKDLKTRLHTSPDIVVAGCSGAVTDEAELPEGDSLLPTLTYANCISAVELKCRKKKPHDDYTIQAGVYARESYFQGHNREQAAYALILTETWIQLLKYDRHGLHRSQMVDIHKDAPSFARIIAGISSSDDKQVGFIDAIRWEDGERVLRLPRLMDPNQEVKEGAPPVELENEVFKILPQKGKLMLLFHRASIRGRGTTCWVAEGARAGRVVAKLAWRYKDRNREWDLLRAARGLEGVGQIYAYCDGLAKLSHSRFWDPAGPLDLILSCVQLKPYGGDVRQFDSPTQLLWAIHDAVKGHMHLLTQRRILHRDISYRNVLLGTMDSEGWRGVLIDFDLAIFVDRGDDVSKGIRTGTRAFQSVDVLRHGGHDHWDDLESFFYVLWWIMLSSKLSFGQIERGIELPPDVLKWEDADILTAAISKELFLRTPAEDNAFLEGTLATRFTELLDDLRQVLSHYLSLKQKAKREHGRDYHLILTTDELKAQYDEFLHPIRKAINAIKPVHEEMSSFFRPYSRSETAHVPLEMTERMSIGIAASMPRSLPYSFPAPLLRDPTLPPASVSATRRSDVVIPRPPATSCKRSLGEESPHSSKRQKMSPTSAFTANVEAPFASVSPAFTGASALSPPRVNATDVVPRNLSSVHRLSSSLKAGDENTIHPVASHPDENDENDGWGMDV